MNNKSVGIDYGNGLTNIDNETGIRYGVISLNNVDQNWLNDFETHYPDTIHADDCDNPENCYCSDIMEATHATYNKDGLICEYSFNSSMNILFIFKSPRIVACRFCSPCVPGAGDLDNPDPNGVQTYALPEAFLAKD